MRSGIWSGMIRNYTGTKLVVFPKIFADWSGMIRNYTGTKPSATKIKMLSRSGMIRNYTGTKQVEQQLMSISDQEWLEITQVQNNVL